MKLLKQIWRSKGENMIELYSNQVDISSVTNSNNIESCTDCFKAKLRINTWTVIPATLWDLEVSPLISLPPWMDGEFLSDSKDFNRRLVLEKIESWLLFCWSSILVRSLFLDDLSTNTKEQFKETTSTKKIWRNEN